MIGQFFLRGSLCSLALAWLGILLIGGHAVWTAYLKYRINSWYSDFYDLVQSGIENGSGAIDYSLSRRAVYSSLIDFVTIISPTLLIHPSLKWFRSVWSFKWRMTLIESYMGKWNPNIPAMEGSAQRTHEDTQRFSRGVEICLSVFLDSVCTLAVFCPILLDVGSEVAVVDSRLSWIGDAWLMILAFFSAFIGIGVAIVAGRRLVYLEVNNQKVEAELRKELVTLETLPSKVCSVEDYGTYSVYASPAPLFTKILESLKRNYYALFKNFFYLNTWLVAFDQVMVIVPYVLCGPLLFSDSEASRISLGTLVRLSNAFDKVFGSLAVISENWAEVNSFRSVIVRLSEFERCLYDVNEIEKELVCSDGAQEGTIPSSTSSSGGRAV